MHWTCAQRARTCMRTRPGDRPTSGTAEAPTLVSGRSHWQLAPALHLSNGQWPLTPCDPGQDCSLQFRLSRHVHQLRQGATPTGMASMWGHTCVQCMQCAAASCQQGHAT
eukprot:jgi/Ulvmu1/3268/UM151_0016.1